MSPEERFAAARAIADAVLYEGYVLYPYRASAAKNQARWQFGVLTPKAFSESEGSERWFVRTESLADAGPDAVLHVRVRCLQVQRRAVEELGDEFVPVDQLEVDGVAHIGWDEAVDRLVDLPALPVGTAAHEARFCLPDGADSEEIRRSDGTLAGRVTRTRQKVSGRVVVTAGPADGGGPLIKLGVTVENTTAWTGTTRRREAVLDRSLVAVHTMLGVEGGRFVSLLDPPEVASDAAAGCHNEGVFPVLVGDDDDGVLSSPIILYDHPAVAPESPGDLYDATEIDEILALRVLTLTDDEKREASSTDARAKAIVERCDAMTPAAWERLHGTMRAVSPPLDGWPTRDGPPLDGPPLDGPSAAPWWDPAVDASVDPWTDAVTIMGVKVAKGSAVRLHPSRRADAQDLFLHDRPATVAGVFEDVDGTVHVAITIDDGPGLGGPGRYLFFFPDELEPVVPAVGHP